MKLTVFLKVFLIGTLIISNEILSISLKKTNLPKNNKKIVRKFHKKTNVSETNLNKALHKTSELNAEEVWNSVKNFFRSLGTYSLDPPSDSDLKEEPQIEISTSEKVALFIGGIINTVLGTVLLLLDSWVQKVVLAFVNAYKCYNVIFDGKGKDYNPLDDEIKPDETPEINDKFEGFRKNVLGELLYSLYVNEKEYEQMNIYNYNPNVKDEVTKNRENYNSLYDYLAKKGCKIPDPGLCCGYHCRNTGDTCYSNCNALIDEIISKPCYYVLPGDMGINQSNFFELYSKYYMLNSDGIKVQIKSLVMFIRSKGFECDSHMVTDQAILDQRIQDQKRLAEYEQKKANNWKVKFKRNFAKMAKIGLCLLDLAGSQLNHEFTEASSAKTNVGALDIKEILNTNPKDLTDLNTLKGWIILDNIDIRLDNPDNPSYGTYFGDLQDTVISEASEYIDTKANEASIEKAESEVTDIDETLSDSEISAIQESTTKKSSVFGKIMKFMWSIIKCGIMAFFKVLLGTYFTIGELIYYTMKVFYYVVKFWNKLKPKYYYFLVGKFIGIIIKLFINYLTGGVSVLIGEKRMRRTKKLIKKKNK